MTALPGLAEWVSQVQDGARRFNEAAARALIELNRRLEEARPMPITGPTITVTRTLAGKAALVERFHIGEEWKVRVDPDLGEAWVLDWARLSLALRDPSDLDLARFLVAERTRARHAARAHVVATAAEMGLNPAWFRQPAVVTA